MAITPTTTVIASPQAGLSRFFFTQISNDLVNPWAGANPSIYTNGSNWYILLFHCTNFGAATDNLVWKLSVFKWDGATWAQQDAANEPGIVNPSLHNGFVYAPNLVAVQVGATLRIPHWNTAGFLAIKIFNMATDQFGATTATALTPGTGPTVAASGVGGGGMSAVYLANTGKITIFADGFSIPIAGQDYQRPAYIQYSVAGDTFDPAFTIAGSDSSVVFPQGSYGCAGDCRDAVNVGILQVNSAGRTSSIYFQSLYSDGTLSAVQSTGVSIPVTSTPGNMQPPCGRIVCTGTEFIIPYANTQDGGSAYFNSISVVRAPAPRTNRLPASWTIQAVHTRDSAYRQVFGFALFVVNGVPIVPYTSAHFFTGAVRIACATYNNGTWTDGATLGTPLTILMERGVFFSENAYISYDLTATATDSAADNIDSGVGNQLFSFIAYTTPVCATLITPGAAGRKPNILTPNQFDWCLHREFRVFQQIDYERLGCGRLPSCFRMDEREWGGWE